MATHSSTLAWTGQVLCAQAWKPGSQHAGKKRGVAGLLVATRMET